MSVTHINPGIAEIDAITERIKSGDASALLALPEALNRHSQDLVGRYGDKAAGQVARLWESTIAVANELADELEQELDRELSR